LTIGAASRILKNQLFGRKLRELYWDADQLRRLLVRLRSPTTRVFARTVRENLALFFLGEMRPVSGETEKRARAAVERILLAQSIGGDGGVSLGCFPCDEAPAPRAVCSSTELPDSLAVATR